MLGNGSKVAQAVLRAQCTRAIRLIHDQRAISKIAPKLQRQVVSRQTRSEQRHLIAKWLKQKIGFQGTTI
jgi:hypothetical protein